MLLLLLLLLWWQMEVMEEKEEAEEQLVVEPGWTGSCENVCECAVRANKTQKLILIQIQKSERIRGGGCGT